MYNRLVIIGAGGHGKVIADIALKNGYKDICFVDDNVDGDCMGYPSVGKSCDLEQLNNGETDFVIAIGDNQIRKRIAEQHKLNWVTLIHPSAQIAYGVLIGIGSVVMAGAVINPEATIGQHCIINTCAVIEHDNQLSDYVHVSPNATLGGTVHVGSCTQIGVGATVRNNISIGNNILVGAGSVVIKNLSFSGIYVGIPACFKKYSK